MLIDSRGPITKAALLNKMTFDDYYERLSLLALSMFTWENLPNGIKPEFLERLLFSEGMAVFYNNEALGHIILHATPSGALNFQDEPTAITAISSSGITDLLENGTQCVLIKNNYLCRPTAITLQLYAQRLTEIERTLDVNVKAQKTPVLVLTEEKTRLTLKNVYNQYDGNQPFIFGDKLLTPEGLKVFKTDAPYLGSDLTDLKHSIWNECMTFLGVNNSNQDKKERLVSDEVGANDDQILLGCEVMLKARKDAADDINKLFGCNIKVRKASEEPEEKEPEMKEGDENEPVHDDD